MLSSWLPTVTQTPSWQPVSRRSSRRPCLPAISDLVAGVRLPGVLRTGDDRSRAGRDTTDPSLRIDPKPENRCPRDRVGSAGDPVRSPRRVGLRIGNPTPDIDIPGLRNGGRAGRRTRGPAARVPAARVPAARVPAARVPAARRTAGRPTSGPDVNMWWCSRARCFAPAGVTAPARAEAVAHGQTAGITRLGRMIPC